MCAIGVLPDVGVFGRRDARAVLPASSLYRCLACHLTFRHPTLPPSAYEALYGDADPACTWPGGPGRVDWALIEEHLGRNAPAGASVLDFGCHRGGLLQQIGPRYARTGIEINRNAAQVARAKTGAEVFPDLASLPAGTCFDVVTAVDVVEHFADPGRVIASLLAILGPGGTLIVSTGDADAWPWRIASARWWYCYYPEHLAFISERWIRNWLRRTGQPVRVAAVRRFRYVHHPPLRYVRQAAATLLYQLAPDVYAWLWRRLARRSGPEGQVNPPGSGLTRDHLLLVVEKLS